MRSVPISGSCFLLSLSLLFVVTSPGRAEAAPPSSDKAATGKASADKGAATAATGPDAVDPWEGGGAPEKSPAGASAAGSTGSSKTGSGAAVSGAAAQEPPPAPPADEPPLDPRTAYHKGNAAFRDGRYTAARHYYRRALEGDTSFDVLCNLGRTEAELKDNVPAYVHLSQCVDAYPKDPELSATRASFSTLREEVQDRLTPEQRTRAEAMLAEGPPQPTPAPAPALATQPAPPAPEVDLGPRSPGLHMAVTLGLGSLALVGLGGGIGFSIYSADLGAQADALRAGIAESGGNCVDGVYPDCQKLHDTLARSDDMQHVALGSFIAAGALATSAVLTYVLWPHDHGPAPSASGPGRATARTFGSLRPTGAFDPARGSMWLGLRGRF